MSFALLGTLAAFILIIVLANRKVPLHLSVLIGTIVVGLCCGYDPLRLAQTIYEALIDRTTVDLLLIIALICVSSYLMQRFALLRRAVEALDRLLPSTKLTIMLVPMLIGCLTVTGGAIISAPMVAQLGERLQLSARRRAAINLLYRHGGQFMFPFVPGIILASQLGGFSGTELATMMIPISIALLFFGYVFLLRDVKVEPTAATERHYLRDLGLFLLNGAAILVPLVLGIGLGQSFVFSLFIGVIIAVLLILYNQTRQQPSVTTIAADLKDEIANSPPRFVMKDIVMGLYDQRKLLFTAAAIMIFRGMIVATDVLRPFIAQMLDQGIPLLLLAILFPFLIGYSTGQISSAIGICWPILATASFIGSPVALAMLMYCSGYCGYFFSPLHMCTVLTNGYFQVELADSYRDLAPVFIPIPVLMTLLYFLYQ